MEYFGASKDNFYLFTYISKSRLESNLGKNQKCDLTESTLLQPHGRFHIGYQNAFMPLIMTKNNLNLILQYLPRATPSNNAK